MKLTALDLLIIAIPLAIVFGTSVYLKRYMRSVADFLAANRCAGRYLIATAMSETSASVMAMIVALELFSRVGWSLNLWNVFSDVAFLLLAILGVVSFRYRQTRSLTFHQFFEVRYSKGVRAFASFLNAFSGLLTFGVQPAVGARFFVYFSGVPEHVAIGGATLPTFVPVMLVLMGMSLYFALTGGQISVIVTDCLEGVISSFFYLVIAGFVIYTLTLAQVRTVMLAGPAGGSFVDPFDIGSRPDFGFTYVAFALMQNLYRYRGNAWNQGFASAAKNPHEIRMAGILGGWRDYSYKAMSALVALGAFTLLHHPDFAAKQAVVTRTVEGIAMRQLHSQMTMPVAIGELFVPGIKGCFCAVLLFGLVAGQGQQLHNYGSTFLQDVFLPFYKKSLSPAAHLRALKGMVFFVAVFACLFSLWFKPVDYLILATALLGALYLGGIGLVVWGGLYSRKGTTAGAWASLLVGASFSVVFFAFQQYWDALQPMLLRLVGDGHVGAYLRAHAERCPLNGQQLSVITSASSALAYVVVSALTWREDFDLDAMLHRGAHAVAADEEPAVAGPPRGRLARFLNVDEHFTRGDKWLTYGTFAWSMTWQAIAIGLLCWTLLVGRLPAGVWFDYQIVAVVGVALAVAVPTTVWFTIGVTRDLIDLIRTLRTARRSDADDGTVTAHHNLEDESLATGAGTRVGARERSGGRESNP